MRTAGPDGEVIDFCIRSEPEVIAVDSPLTEPRGAWREVDREMLRLGFRVLPPGMPGMRQLTRRGVRLALRLRSAGLSVVEVHPSSSARALGVERSLSGAGEVLTRLFGLDPPERASRHEVDAILAALTGALHVLGLSRVVEAADGSVVIPAARLDELERGRSPSRRRASPQT